MRPLIRSIDLGTGGATLRFGRVWTGAMITQVALTAIGIPIAMETASQVMRKVNIRAEFPSREYLAARIDLDRPFEEEATPALPQALATAKICQALTSNVNLCIASVWG